MAQLPSSARVNQYTATAGQTTFIYDFKIYNDDEIKVQQGDTTLTLTTDYTVTDAGEDAGGTVVLVTGATSGDIITLTGNSMVERGTTFSQGGDFLASAINGEFNRIDNLLSELVTESTTNFKLATYSETVSAIIPNPSANKALVWNAGATALENSTYDPDDAGTYAAAAAASASAASDSETAAAGSASDASGYADAASDSADAAAASAASINLGSLASDIIPATTDTYNLGDSSHRFLNIYCNDLYVQDDILLTDNLTMYGGDITVLNGHTITADGTITSNTGIVTPTINSGYWMDTYSEYSYTVAQNTAGGGATTGAWQTRPINTEDHDDLSMSVASNQITVPAGTYMFTVVVESYLTDDTRIRLYDTTGSASLAISPSAYTGTSGVQITLNGIFTVASSSALEVQQLSNRAQATNGLGKPMNNAVSSLEKYLQIMFWRVG